MKSAAGFLDEERGNLRDPPKSKKVWSTCVLREWTQMLIFVSVTGCCLEIDEYIQSSGCLLVKVKVQASRNMAMLAQEQGAGNLQTAI